MMGHTTVVQTGSEQRIYQKTERKRREEHFAPASNNCSNCRRHIHYPGPLLTCWLAVEQFVNQLLDTGPKCSSFRSSFVCFFVFFFLTEPVLRTFWYHCRIAHDAGGLWCNVFCRVFVEQSEKDGDRTMNASIEPFTFLIWILMTPNVEFKTLPTFYIIVFGHDMLALVMVIQFVPDNEKRHTIQKFQQFAFEWYINQ